MSITSVRPDTASLLQRPRFYSSSWVRAKRRSLRARIELLLSRGNHLGARFLEERLERLTSLKKYARTHPRYKM